MFAIKKKKFLLHEKYDIAPAVEIEGLTTLLEICLQEENYEIAIIIRNRIAEINKNKS